MEIVVKGRNSEISDRFREHVIEKLQRIDKYDQRKQIHRVECLASRDDIAFAWTRCSSRSRCH